MTDIELIAWARRLAPRDRPNAPPSGVIKLPKNVPLPPMGYTECASFTAARLVVSVGAKVFYVNRPGYRDYYIPSWCYELLLAIGPILSEENRRAILSKAMNDPQWRAALHASGDLVGPSAMVLFASSAPGITDAGASCLRTRAQRLAWGDGDGDEDE